MGLQVTSNQLKVTKQYYKFKLLKLKPNEQTFELIKVNSVTKY